MKTMLALPLFALALAGCMPPMQGPGYPGYPGPEPYPPAGYPPQGYPPVGNPPTGYPPTDIPQGEAGYRAIGTEPFWSLDVGTEMVFTNADGLRVAQPTPPAINGVAGEIYQTARINLNIVHTQCSDGMSNRTYPDTVQVRVDGREYRGCGAPRAYYSQVGESGQPNQPMPPGNPGPPVMDINSTNWRVISINGMRTPASSFYINFMPDRMSAKFGCNSLGAGYSQNGDQLNAGAIMATRMACSDMGFENQAIAILEQPMTISGLGEQMTLSNRAGSIELVRAR